MRRARGDQPRRYPPDTKARNVENHETERKFFRGFVFSWFRACGSSSLGYFVAPPMTFFGSTTVETPAAFMTRSSTAAVCGENLKFMPR